MTRAFHEQLSANIKFHLSKDQQKTDTPPCFFSVAFYRQSQRVVKKSRRPLERPVLTVGPSTDEVSTISETLAIALPAFLAPLWL